jgi:hypothetical protein
MSFPDYQPLTPGLFNSKGAMVDILPLRPPASEGGAPEDWPMDLISCMKVGVWKMWAADRLCWNWLIDLAELASAEVFGLGLGVQSFEVCPYKPYKQEFWPVKDMFNCSRQGRSHWGCAIHWTSNSRLSLRHLLTKDVMWEMHGHDG